MCKISLPYVNRLKMFWLVVNVAVFCKTYHYYATRPEFYYLREMLGVGLLLSRASASVLNINCSLIFLPVCRCINSTIHLAFSLVNRSWLKCWLYNIQSIHVMLASIILFASVIHIIGHVLNVVNASGNFNKQYPSVNWAYLPNESPVLIILRTISGSSGLFMVLFLLTMSFFSLPWFRKNDYVLFSTAHGLFLPFVILFFIHPLSKVLKQQTNCADHIPGCTLHGNCTAEPIFTAIPLQSWKWMLPTISVYLIDSVYRIVMRNKLNFYVKHVRKYPGNVYRLVLSGNRFVKALPAQYILLQCSNISSVEWHPFTVVSCTSNENRTQSDITVIIQACGDWTNSLARYLESNVYDFNCEFGICKSVTSKKFFRLKFLIDGGFFSPLSDVINEDVAFCVAFGIGITPFASVLVYLRKFWNFRNSPSRLHLVWVVPHCEHLLWFEDLFCDIHNKVWSTNKPDSLEYSFYVTRETNYSKIKNVVRNPLIRNRTYFGKPEWSTILQTWHSLYYRSSYQLFICGSRKTMRCVENACRRLSRKGVTFRCVHETFT